jgi:hypothetical protein
MSDLTKSIAPPNSVIFIADPSSRYHVPSDSGAALITSTSSCIGVGTLAEMDGETVVSLSEEFVTPRGNLAFDGMLETPNLRVAIIDSEGNSLLAMSTRSKVSSVKIWVNDASEPDNILVQVAR